MSLEFRKPHPAAAAAASWGGGVGGGAKREAALVSGVRAEAVQGSQVPRSVLSRERLLVFRGDTGLGGLLRLELLEAVECLGESESCRAQRKTIRSTGAGGPRVTTRPLQPP